jgi:hypothetical protein
MVVAYILASLVITGYEQSNHSVINNIINMEETWTAT